MNLELSELKIKSELVGKEATIQEVVSYLRRELPKQKHAKPEVLRKRAFGVAITKGLVVELDQATTYFKNKFPDMKINRSVIVRALLSHQLDKLKEVRGL